MQPDGSYPNDDRSVALVFIDQNFQLPLELGLLVGVRGPVAVGGHARHVLDDQQTELVASAVEEIGLDFDL